jgi:3-deoxy-manno-octulosonate cytidylyltransferase (CMP-KDO synthetase)
MSRSSIPGNKNGSFQKAWRQVCVYAFPKTALQTFIKEREKTSLEAQEDIEILRFLELGYEVRMIPLSIDSIAVDVPEDVQRVKQKLKEIE